MADVNLNSFHIRTLLRIRPGVSLLPYTTVDSNESPSGLNATSQAFVIVRICYTSLSVPEASRHFRQIPLSLLAKCHSPSPLGICILPCTHQSSTLLQRPHYCGVMQKHPDFCFCYQSKNYAGVPISSWVRGWGLLVKSWLLHVCLSA